MSELLQRVCALLKRRIYWAHKRQLQTTGELINCNVLVWKTSSGNTEPTNWLGGGGHTSVRYSQSMFRIRIWVYWCAPSPRLHSILSHKEWQNNYYTKFRRRSIAVSLAPTLQEENKTIPLPDCPRCVALCPHNSIRLSHKTILLPDCPRCVALSTHFHTFVSQDNSPSRLSTLCCAVHTLPYVYLTCNCEISEYVLFCCSFPDTKHSSPRFGVDEHGTLQSSEFSSN
jgi:hypothetical protein